MAENFAAFDKTGIVTGLRLATPVEPLDRALIDVQCWAGHKIFDEPSLREPLREVINDLNIVKFVQRSCGSDAVLYDVQYVDRQLGVTPAGSAGGWHTDDYRAFLDRRGVKISVQIYLSDSTSTNCLEVVPGAISPKCFLIDVVALKHILLRFTWIQVMDRRNALLGCLQFLARSLAKSFFFCLLNRLMYGYAMVAILEQEKLKSSHFPGFKPSRNAIYKALGRRGEVVIFNNELVHRTYCRDGVSRRRAVIARFASGDSGILGGQPHMLKRFMCLEDNKWQDLSTPLQNVFTLSTPKRMFSHREASEAVANYELGHFPATQKFPLAESQLKSFFHHILSNIFFKNIF